MTNPNPMPVEASAEDRWTPYRHPQPKDSPPELIVPNVIPTDERVWVPVDDNVWFRPLLFCVTRGYWMNLLKVRRAGVLSRHRHPLPVHGYVLKGKWRYLEHDWVATAGDWIYEAPGEAHTLVAYESPEPMRVTFNVTGPLIWLDENGQPEGHFDVFDYIELCKNHYEKVGIGAGYIDRLFR